METTEKLQKLPETIENLRGVGIPDLTATCVERTDKKAIYRRSDGVYEVFKIKIQEAGEMFGKFYPRREMYPGNEDFGKIAWCFNTYHKAIKCYREFPIKI